MRGGAVRGCCGGVLALAGGGSGGVYFPLTLCTHFVWLTYNRGTQLWACGRQASSPRPTSSSGARRRVAAASVMLASALRCAAGSLLARRAATAPAAHFATDNSTMPAATLLSQLKDKTLLKTACLIDGQWLPTRVSDVHDCCREPRFVVGLSY